MEAAFVRPAVAEIDGVDYLVEIDGIPETQLFRAPGLLDAMNAGLQQGPIQIPAHPSQLAADIHRAFR